MTNLLEIKLSLDKKSETTFYLERPVSISRPIFLKENHSSSGAFYLPSFKSVPFTHESGFIGDIDKRGSCNVSIISFSPHNFTHIETSSHITNNIDVMSTVKDLNPETINGLVFMFDCTSEAAIEDNKIKWQYLKDKLDSLVIIPKIIALKTKASHLPQDYDFSGKDFLSLTENTLKNLRREFPVIRVIILDLPSVDSEMDTDLRGHKIFLLPNGTKNIFNDKNPRAIVELAHFGSLEEFYYYCMITPAKVETDAIITDIVFWRLKKKYENLVT